MLDEATGDDPPGDVPRRFVFVEGTVDAALLLTVENEKIMIMLQNDHVANTDGWRS
jgi:hypothetical protein